MIQHIITPTIIGYLLGSISFAVLICKSKGIDIFKVGSGNAGATNVKRALGSFWSRLVFSLDFTKGILAVIIGTQLGSGSIIAGISCLIGAIIGHSFSIFLKFKGGRGVATTMGGLLILAPWTLIIGLVIWLWVFWGTRYVSVASMAFGLSLPILTYAFNYPRPVLGLTFILMLLNLALHSKNIRRLWLGTENKFEKS